MPKYNVRAYYVKPVLDFSKVNDEVRFKPCASGAELSVGFTPAGPAQESLVWNVKGKVIMEWSIQTRRVPKPWLEAEFRRRLLPGMSVEEQFSLNDSIKAELWHKIVPVTKHGWLCYDPEQKLLVVHSSPRHAEYITGVLRQALGSLQIDCAYHPQGFQAMVRSLVRGDELDNLQMGRRIDVYEGDGRNKKIVSFKNYPGLAGNADVFRSAGACQSVAAAGFMVEEIEEEVDDFVATPYGELTIIERQDKEADGWGTMLIRFDRVSYLIGELCRESDNYATEKWRETV